MRELRHKEIIPHIEAALKGQRSKYYGLYEATTTDAKIWSSTTLAPMYNKDGEIIGGIGIVEDISEMKKYEWALEESRAHLEAVLESASGYGILTTDPNLVITYFNKEAERIFGNSSTLAEGGSLEKLTGRFGSLKEHFITARESIENKKVYDFTIEKKDNGKQILVAYSQLLDSTRWLSWQIYRFKLNKKRYPQNLKEINATLTCPITQKPLVYKYDEVEDYYILEVPEPDAYCVKQLKYDSDTGWEFEL